MPLRPGLLVFLAAGSAAAAPTSDEKPAAVGTEPLQLDVSVDPTAVVPTRSGDPKPSAPHSATVRLTLTNVTAQDRELSFACPCFLGFEVEAPDGSVVGPEGGGTTCASMMADVRLPAGGKETRELRWTARSWKDTAAPLPPGRYKVYGTMGKGACGADRNGHPPMRTPPVTVEVRPVAN